MPALTRKQAVFLFLIGLALFALTATPIILFVLRDGPQGPVIYGDVERLRRYLRDHPGEVNSIDREGRALIHLAAWHKQAAAAEALAELGADVNAIWGPPDDPTSYLWNALHIAAVHGDPETVRTLIRLGVDVDRRARDGETPFDIASRKGRTEASLLIRHEQGRRRAQAK